MEVEDHIVDAIIAELRRQVAEPGQKLSIEERERPMIHIEGDVDLESVAMVVMGSLAGGP
jgi:hypothetical protein